ncbi:MAG: UDP-3-O-(3-hydroxymyristoyl)glucosamine N-acyltransferase [Pseudomonadaceae bacterium]|nr:UDP-3-O-(3-hydroxymyristoyl)glucosamine N-acyltransferase [Pseudomonadaceae bacterium]
MPLTLADLCGKLGLDAPALHGGRVISAVKPLGEAGVDSLSFLENPAYKKALQETKAGAVLLREAEAALVPEGSVALVCANPYVMMARALALLHPVAPVVAGVSAQAVVSDKAEVDPTARIEPGAVVYAGAQVGARAHIGAHTVVGEGVVVGEDCRIGPHCSLLKTRMGARCVVHGGVRMGQDGFGFAVDGQALVKVPQVGGVVVGDDVEIGANSTIDCGALGDTVIGDMVKIDNQVQVGHNVRIGRGSRIVAQTGLAGSSTLGEFTLIGGQVGVAGHITLADRVMVAARSGVTKSIDAVGAVVAGLPAEPIMEWRRKVALLARMAKKGKKAANGGDSGAGEA